MPIDIELKPGWTLICKKPIQYRLELHEWINRAIAALLSKGVAREFFSDLSTCLYKVVFVAGKGYWPA